MPVAEILYLQRTPASGEIERQFSTFRRIQDTTFNIN
jgi:hypothetical protein